MGGSEESFLDEGELDFFPEDYFEEPTPALKEYDPNYRHSCLLYTSDAADDC